MNREEAIAIIRKEYLCVDRDCDIERNCGKCDLMMPSKEPILEAYKIAIKALEQEPKTDSWSIKDVVDTFKKHGLIREQEPCEDAISREDALMCLTGEIKETDMIETIIARFARRIKKLPPVNPTKTGWIPVSERLPEICEKDCHGDITFSKTVIATQIYGNGYVYVGIDKYTTNNGGGWLSEVPFDNPDECCKVIAWMPLPKPYEPQERSDNE